MTPRLCLSDSRAEVTLLDKAIFPMLSALLPAFLAIAAGVSIVIQQALNANLRNAMHSTAWSGFVSYAVGLACMALLARPCVP